MTQSIYFYSMYYFREVAKIFLYQSRYTIYLTMLGWFYHSRSWYLWTSL